MQNPSEDDISEQLALLQMYRQTLSHYLRQQASLGKNHTPPGVTHGIIEAATDIRRIKQILRNWGVDVDDHPDDDADISLESPAEKRVFTNVWYTPRKYRFWEYRNPDIGTLIVEPDVVTYTGEKHKIVITNLMNVTHTRQGGSINNNWVRVDYGDGNASSTAFFAQASRLGVGELIGGSDEIFIALRRLVK
jgi:hypothetical protein